jgi:transmembrane sensor
VTVRALGTAFVVRRDGDGTTVAVTEHAVRISHNSDNVRVSAGQSSTYSPKTGLVPPHPIDVEGVTAWRRGELAFDGRTLDDVISEINRYHRSRILILDQDVGRLPVSGVFDAANADTLLASIELALPVKVIRLPGLAIVRRDASRPLFPR